MELVNVRGDGSCFFRALYRAAKDAGEVNLTNITNAFNYRETLDINGTPENFTHTADDEVLKISDTEGYVVADVHFVSLQEDAFVRFLRDSIATRILSNSDDNRYENMFNYIKELRTADIETYNQVISI